MRYSRCAIALSAMAAVGLTACAARVAKDNVQAKLVQRVHALERKQTAMEQRIDDLGNQVFLLEDKLDTARVALERRPEAQALGLPVVHLAPETAQVGRSSAAWSAKRNLAGAGPQGLSEEELQDSTAAVSQPDYWRGREVRQPNQEREVSSVVATDTVEYRGAASRDAVHRPILRLHGEGEGTSGERSESLGLTEPLPTGERLPIAPVAEKQVARALAEGESTDQGAIRLYQQAMETFRLHSYPAAKELFSRFLKQFSGHAYADNALYWRGECAYDQKDFREAARDFSQVLKRYSNGNKAPDALLKLGYSQLQLGQAQEARRVLQQVLQLYPKSKVAELAAQKLTTLR